MKRILTIMFLVLAISASLLAGTLSMYTITIDDLAEGNIVAKEFRFVSEGTDSFEQNVKIAPTEEVQWEFSVQNYEDDLITETDLYYRLTFQVEPTENKKAIEPLLVTVKDQPVDTSEGIGTLDLYGEFLKRDVGQREDYEVKIYWPSTEDDILYAGEGFGTTVKVSAVARQMPFDEQEPEVPEEPEPSGIVVQYMPGVYWGNEFYFNPKIEITNNSEEDVSSGWEIKFKLPGDKITEVYDPNYTLTYDEEEGYYTIHSPSTNTGYAISTGESKEISAKGRALSDEPGAKPGPMEDVTLNGISVVLVNN